MPRETTCPNCSANIPVDPLDRVGHVIYCSYCNIGLRIMAEPPEPGADVVVKELEEEE
jgi:DNA-directed RNA polymerase subunit RPC12/RpoP